MEGFIKIENVVSGDREGLSVECRLSKVTVVDKFHVLHCLCRALDIDREDLVVFGELEKLSLWEEPEEIDLSAAHEMLNTLFGGHDEG